MRARHDVEPLSKHEVHHAVGKQERPEYDTCQRVLALALVEF